MEKHENPCPGQITNLSFTSDSQNRAMNDCSGKHGLTLEWVDKEKYGDVSIKCHNKDKGTCKGLGYKNLHGVTKVAMQQCKTCLENFCVECAQNKCYQPALIWQINDFQQQTTHNID